MLSPASYLDLSIIIQSSELHPVSPFYLILFFYNFTSNPLKGSLSLFYSESFYFFGEFPPQNTFLHNSVGLTIMVSFFVPPALFCCFVEAVVKHHLLYFQREVLLRWKKKIELVHSVLPQLDNCHS